MGIEWVTALFTLCGVIVGVAATTGSQIYLENKREKREAQRARRLVAGEMLQAQMIFRGVSRTTSWPPIDNIDAWLPTSAWRENRSRIADAVDADLFDQLVMTYAGIELDRERFVTAAKLVPPSNEMTASEAAALRKAGYDLGRLRRRLEGGGGGWLDEITEEVRAQIDSLRDSFMRWFAGLREADLRQDGVIAKVKQMSQALADLDPEGGGDWLAEITSRIEEANTDQTH